MDRARSDDSEDSPVFPGEDGTDGFPGFGNGGRLGGGQGEKGFEGPGGDQFLHPRFLYIELFIYQPVYRGKRTDVYIEACTTGQLKYKPEGRDDEDA